MHLQLLLLCWPKPIIPFLMNPKSGGSTLKAFSVCIRSCTGKKNLFATYMHLVRNVKGSYVSLREPCARAESSYWHLKKAYSDYGECQGTPLPPACAKHWIHKVNLSQFVERLPREIPERINPAGATRHLVVIKPQYYWVENASRVICTQNLTAELDSLRRRYAVENKCGNCTNFHTNSHAYASQMTPEICDAVNKLYSKDKRLYDKFCGAA